MFRASDSCLICDYARVINVRIIIIIIIMFCFITNLDKYMPFV